MINYEGYFEKISKEIINDYINKMIAERQSGEVGFYDLPLEFEIGISKLKEVKKSLQTKVIL